MNGRQPFKLLMHTLLEVFIIKEKKKVISNCQKKDYSVKMGNVFSSVICLKKLSKTVFFTIMCSIAYKILKQINTSTVKGI